MMIEIQMPSPEGKALANILCYEFFLVTKIVCHPERSEAESKDLFAEITHKSNLKCEDPSTSFRYAPFRSG